MVAACIMVLGLLGTIGTCICAHDLSDDARHRDQARALLQSFASRFQRLEINDPATNTPIAFFQPTTTQTGVGLEWVGATSTADFIAVRLGGDDPDSPLAQITREVRDINETTGVNDATSNAESDAGKILVATFRATYLSKGIQKQETITIARTTR